MPSRAGVAPKLGPKSDPNSGGAYANDGRRASQFWPAHGLLIWDFAVPGLRTKAGARTGVTSILSIMPSRAGVAPKQGPEVDPNSGGACANSWLSGGGSQKSLHSVAPRLGRVCPPNHYIPWLWVRVAFTLPGRLILMLRCAVTPRDPPMTPPVPWGGFSPRCRGRLLVRATPSRPHATPLLGANRHVGMGM